MITAGVLLFIAVLAWDIVTDYHKWLKGKVVNHTKEWWLRAALLFPAVGSFAAALPIHWLKGCILSAAMIAFAWWLLFDGIYNLLRGFGWWFNGSKDAANDGWLDSLLMQMEDWQEALLKILPITILIFVYLIVLYQ